MPRIAIIDNNMLAAIGLAGIIRGMMPAAELSLFSDFSALEREDKGNFIHYFVSASILLGHANYFLPRSRHTMVLVCDAETQLIPRGFHLLCVNQNEGELTRAILRLAETSHARKQVAPIPKADAPMTNHILTPREIEVVKWIVSGKTNKETAEALGVGVATVISHRKNIMKKLNTRSVSALTIYAVMHGIVSPEEI